MTTEAPYEDETSRDLDVAEIDELEKSRNSSSKKGPPKSYALPPIINLESLWDDDSEPFEPTMISVEGGQPLLYQACSHLLFGTGGSGKSMFCQHCTVEVLTAGGTVLYIDYENSARTIVDRLKTLGLEREHLPRLGYWRINEDLTPWMQDGLRKLLEHLDNPLVILDGVAKSIGAAGLDEDKNRDCNTWDSNVIVPMCETGATVLQIDHVVKPSADRGGGATNPAALYPRGGGSKINAVTGAAYLFTATQEWTKTSSGWAEVTTAKDREGTRKKGAVAAKCEVTVDPDAGQVRFRVYAPQPAATTESGKVRRTWYMEQVSRALEDAGEPMSLRSLKQAVGRRKEFVGAAVDVLREEGHVSSPKGKPIVLAKPYRVDDDPLAEPDDRPASGGYEQPF